MVLFNLILLHSYTVLYTVMIFCEFILLLILQLTGFMRISFFFLILRTAYSSEISGFCGPEGNSAQASQATSNGIYIVVDSN